MLPFENIHLRTVNQRVLGSSPRGGAKSPTNVGFFCFNMEYCVYILHSEKLSRFYTGYTSNFDVRAIFHNNPDSRKFTYKAEDWNLFLKVHCESQQQAMNVEKHIKRMKSAAYVRNLKKYPEMIDKLLKKNINKQLPVNQSPDSYRGWFEPKRRSTVRESLYSDVEAFVF